MKCFLAAAALLTSIVATQSAQAQNFNVINGNGNRVVNGGGGGRSFAGNHNGINGHGNTLINGGGGYGYQAPLPISGGHSCNWKPAMNPQYQHQSVQYQTVQHYQTAVPPVRYPQTYAYHPQPIQPRYRTRRASNPLGIPINVNYNSVRGNANTIVNGGSTRPQDVAIDVLGQLASGSAQRNGLNININKVRGNKNTVINR